MLFVLLNKALHIKTMNQPHPNKKGRICCFFLMDMRRAVMFINLLSIIVNGLTLILIHVKALAWYEGGNEFEEVKQTLTDDPPDQADIDTIDDLLRKVTILTVIGLGVSAGAFYGALTYEKRFIMLQVTYSIVNLILQIQYRQSAANDVDTYDYNVTSDIGSIIGTVISIYVHISLIKEIQCGTMSPETYSSREAYSYCCFTMPSDNDGGGGAAADDDDTNTNDDHDIEKGETSHTNISNTA
jgi:hypothetical protein